MKQLSLKKVHINENDLDMTTNILLVRNLLSTRTKWVWLTMAKLIGEGEIYYMAELISEGEIYWAHRLWLN